MGRRLERLSFHHLIVLYQISHPFVTDEKRGSNKVFLGNLKSKLNPAYFADKLGFQRNDISLFLVL